MVTMANPNYSAYSPHLTSAYHHQQPHQAPLQQPNTFYLSYLSPPQCLSPRPISPAASTTASTTGPRRTPSRSSSVRSIKSETRGWHPYQPTTPPPPQDDMSSSGMQCFRPSRAEDWEPYRAVIEELYRNKKLKDVMEEMESVYFFKATTRQYKTKIKEWGLDEKYIKTNEYIAILKVKRRREREDPNRATEFYLRGKRVDPSSITRFESRATKRGLITPEDTLSDRESIGEELQCFTPLAQDFADVELSEYYDHDAPGEPVSSSSGYGHGQ